jgi:hypothetical protein
MYSFDGENSTRIRTRHREVLSYLVKMLSSRFFSFLAFAAVVVAETFPGGEFLISNVESHLVLKGGDVVRVKPISYWVQSLTDLV